MRNLLKPLWFMVIHILPLTLLTILLFRQYHLIASMLDEYEVSLWKSFSYSLLIIVLISSALAIALYKTQKQVTWIHAACMLLVNIAYIWFFGNFEKELFPPNIPSWLYFGSYYNILASLIFPSIIYAIVAFVLNSVDDKAKHRAWPNYVSALIIPLVAYTLSQVMFPLFRTVDEQFYHHSMVVLVIAGILLFLFFVIRGIYVQVINRTSRPPQPILLIAKLLFSVFFPLLGLAINSGFDLSYSSTRQGGIFGDFNNVWFFILAIVNGVAVSIYGIKQVKYRFVLFIIRSITFVYSLYFFLVFLPYTPLAVPLVLYMGLGVLMLSPIILMLIHVVTLVRDFNFLRSSFSSRKLVITMLVSFTIIPSAITINFSHDKKVLHEALEYVYFPSHDKEYDLNKTAIRRALNEVDVHRSNNNDDFLFFDFTPYISTFYNWLVLDNLSLSREKTRAMKHVFFGEVNEHIEPRIEFEPSEIVQDVQLTNVLSESQFDEAAGFWRTWIHLELTNTSSINFQEYETIFKLPEGCWISDYYLNIEGRKEFGILAEKKSAMWVYSSIRNVRRDPGILNYLTGNKIQFRVFPFSNDEVRETGIEFIHAEPLTLTLDNQIIELGDKQSKTPEIVETTHGIYVSKKAKESLHRVSRTPYFHFIVDVSFDKKEKTDYYIKRIKELVAQYPTLSKQAKISFVNTYNNTYDLDDKWAQVYQNQKFEGGFYLDKAMRDIFLSSRNESKFPVVVVLTENMNEALIHHDFADLEFAFPEQEDFYFLNYDGRLKAHSLLLNSNIARADSCEIPTFSKVLAFPLNASETVYLPDNQSPSVVVKNLGSAIYPVKNQENTWLRGLELQSLWLQRIITPSNNNKDWLELVKYSFEAQIMTPVTSFIALENENQKQLLLRKQEEILKGHKALDAMDEPMRMSEPDLWILAMLLLLAFTAINRKTLTTKFYKN